MRVPSLRSLLFPGVVLLLVACAADGEAPESMTATPDAERLRVIAGEVLYRERIMLPTGAEVRVFLEDQSKADVAAEVITDYTHGIDGAPPYPFRLVYDPDAIDPRGRYGIRVRIEHGGRLLFTTTEHVDPFAGPAGEPLQIIVRRASG